MGRPTSFPCLFEKTRTIYNKYIISRHETELRVLCHRKCVFITCPSCKRAENASYLRATRQKKTRRRRRWNSLAPSQVGILCGKLACRSKLIIDPWQTEIDGGAVGTSKFATFLQNRKYITPTVSLHGARYNHSIFAVVQLVLFEWHTVIFVVGFQKIVLTDTKPILDHSNADKNFTTLRQNAEEHAISRQKIQFKDYPGRSTDLSQIISKLQLAVESSANLFFCHSIILWSL